MMGGCTHQQTLEPTPHMCRLQLVPAVPTQTPVIVAGMQNVDCCTKAECTRAGQLLCTSNSLLKLFSHCETLHFQKAQCVSEVLEPWCCTVGTTVQRASQTQGCTSQLLHVQVIALCEVDDVSLYKTYASAGLKSYLHFGCMHVKDHQHTGCACCASIRALDTIACST
jgi:hypothetical protein